MKIAYFGTGEFSKNILEKLTNLDQIKIKLIVSQPDKAKGRYKNIIKTPVKELGEKLGIEVLQPEKINTEILLEKINLLGLDFIIVVAYGKIIPKKILDAPKYMSINIHGSLLPKYRGASPIQEALINGDTKTGLTLIKMNEKMDEGDIISAKEINIDILDTSKSIFTRFEEIGPQLLIDSLNKIKSGNIKTIPQNNKNASYCTKIQKNDGRIFFGKESSEKIYNKWRAYSIWPGIFSYYNGKKISIIECFYDNNNLKNKKAGEVYLDENKNIFIKCSFGSLLLKKIQIEGKKVLDTNNFINGNKDFLKYIFD